MTAYSENLSLIEPTPADPAVANVWGTLLNTNQNLLDAAIAGLLPKSVAGAGNVVLTTNDGAADESRYGTFVFSGVRTGDGYVLWPAAKTFKFIVKNDTTGAFSLSLGVNNGSGSPVGTTVTIAQGDVGFFYSDGVNVTSAISPGGLGALAVDANLSDVADPPTAYTNIGGGTMGKRALFIQNGGSPSGGADGDVTFIW